MPAAAVIPAPIAYIKVVAVKKLVVGFLLESDGAHLVRYLNGFGILWGNVSGLNWTGRDSRLLL